MLLRLPRDRQRLVLRLSLGRRAAGVLRPAGRRAHARHQPARRHLPAGPRPDLHGQRRVGRGPAADEPDGFHVGPARRPSPRRWRPPTTWWPSPIRPSTAPKRPAATASAPADSGGPEQRPAPRKAPTKTPLRRTADRGQDVLHTAARMPALRQGRAAPTSPRIARTHGDRGTDPPRAFQNAPARGWRPSCCTGCRSRRLHPCSAGPLS